MINLTPNNFYSIEEKEFNLAKSYFDGAKLLFEESQKEQNKSKTFSSVIYPCLFLLQQSLEISLKAHYNMIIEYSNNSLFESDLPSSLSIDKDIFKKHSLTKVLNKIKEITKHSKNHNHKKLFDLEKTIKWFDEKNNYIFRFIRNNGGNEEDFHKELQEIPTDIIDEVEKIIELLYKGYDEFHFRERDRGLFDDEEKLVIEKCLHSLKEVYQECLIEYSEYLKKQPLKYLNELDFEESPKEERSAICMRAKDIEILKYALAGYYFVQKNHSCSNLLQTINKEMKNKEELIEKLLEQANNINLDKIDLLQNKLSVNEKID